jgi:hypothetical protein
MPTPRKSIPLTPRIEAREWTNWKINSWQQITYQTQQFCGIGKPFPFSRQNTTYQTQP